MIDLGVKLGRLELQNPILTSSGCFGYGQEFMEFFDLDRLGAITLKSVTLEPKEGNDPPRLAETPSGMLNSIGLANCGIKSLIKEKLPLLESFTEVKVIANIAGHSIDENASLANILNQEQRVDALELNVSCPNVDSGGLAFCFNREELKRLISRVRDQFDKPLIVKLPYSAEIVSLAQDCVDCGAEILSLINTIPGLEVDVDNKKLFFKRGYAGLSGPAIRPIALKSVYDVAKSVKAPLIGMGGVAGLEDVLKFMMVGANAVSVGMMNFVDPEISVNLVDALELFLKNRATSLFDLVGSI